MSLLHLLLLGYVVVSVLAVLVIYATCVVSGRIRRLEEREKAEIVSRKAVTSTSSAASNGLQGPQRARLQSLASVVVFGQKK